MCKQVNCTATAVEFCDPCDIPLCARHAAEHRDEHSYDESRNLFSRSMTRSPMASRVTKARPRIGDRKWHPVMANAMTKRGEIDKRRKWRLVG